MKKSDLMARLVGFVAMAALGMLVASGAWGQYAPPSLSGYGLNGSTQVVLNSTGILGVLGFAHPAGHENRVHPLEESHIEKAEPGELSHRATLRLRRSRSLNA